MSIPNRTVSITGVFAADASTTIPETPVSGSSYRNTSMTGTAIREGWAYKTIVDSANFNQALYEYSSVTAQVEKYGFLPWSNLTDYVQGSVCLGSNGKIYQAKQATGPSSTSYDPTTTPSVWDPVILGVTEFLFNHIWTDYQLNRQDWLRADTFSWQNGVTYENAYNHLVSDVSGISPTTETIGSYTVTYYQATDGHKICLADQETTLSNIYSESGVAWYYILDTDNQRFKLPRENPNLEKYEKLTSASVAVKGNGKVLGFYNGSEFGMTNRASGYGIVVGNNITLGQTNAGSSSTTADGTKDRAIGLVTNENKSGIVGTANLSGASKTSVYKGKQYLYFYVGQFSQSATEQTAGLNSELFNGKVDLNAQNLSASGKSLISGLGMPSDRYIDLTLGADGTTYTAPANGYVSFSRVQTANGLSYTALQLRVNDSILFQVESAGTVVATGQAVLLPVRKGDIFMAGYGGAAANLRQFRFIYAEGEPNV